MQDTLTQIFSFAKERKIPAATLAAYVGCSRVSLYNWLEGKPVRAKFSPRLEELLQHLQAGRGREDLEVLAAQHKELV